MSRRTEYAETLVAIGAVTLFNKALDPIIGYRAVGFVYVLAIVLLGLRVSKGPVLSAAIFSAVLWNFLFIPPLHTFEISSSEDIMMLIAFLAISLLTGILLFERERLAKKANRLKMLEESERIYETMLDLISHEMRTPLTAIIGSSTALMEEKIKNDPKSAAVLLEAILNAGERLNSVVSNLLDMSRLSASGVKVRDDVFEVSELAETCLEKQRRPLRLHRTSFTKDGNDVMIKGDFKLLEHALSNLLLNAAAYSPEDGEILVTSCAVPQGVQIEIYDRGPGIPEPDLENIFEKFFRVPGTPSGGTGLGLSIVKRIVELHGGAVSAANRPGGGAVFTLRVPRGASGN